MKKINYGSLIMAVGLSIVWFCGGYLTAKREFIDSSQCKKDTIFTVGVVMTPEQLELFNNPDFESYIKDTAYHRWINDHYLRNKYKDK